MRKHDVPKLRYVLIGALTIITFLFGLLLGNYLTEQKLRSVTEIEENLRIQTAGAELQFLILLQEPCDHINSTPLAEDLYDISEKLDFMEAQRGENNEDVRRLKNAYSLLQIRHWLFTQNTNVQCELSDVPVLYFYSNQGDCPQCKEQGYTLTYLRRKYPQMKVYAFDITTTNPALDTIKRIYNIEETPVLLFPDDRRQFSTIDEIETLLTEKYNLTAQP